jgi:hypothetical protein
MSATGQKIDVGLCNELFSVNAEAGKQRFGDSLSFGLGLLSPEHNLQFEKISQTLNSVEMHASLTDKV